MFALLTNLETYIRLSWKPHVSQLLRKLRPAIACIAKLRRSASRRVVLMTYHALFESHLRYGLLAYGSAFRSVLGPVEKIQNSCVRLISRKSRRTSSNVLYDQLGVLPLRKLYLSVLLTHLQIRQPHVAIRLEDDNTPDHQYNTRGAQSGNIRLPAFRLERTRRLYSRQYLSVINALPPPVRAWRTNRVSIRKKNIREFVNNLSTEELDKILP